MTGEKPHLALIYDEQISSDLLDEFFGDIEAQSLDFQRVPRPPEGTQLSLEWFAIPAVAFFLLKPYFDGFMKEAGKDHYIILKKALTGLWSQFFSKDRIFRVVVIASPQGKVEREYSPSFAIYAETKNGRQVRFLIHEDCPKDEYVEGVDAFLNLIESYYSGVPSEKLLIDLDGEKGSWEPIFIAFEKESKSLRVLDPISHAKKRASRSDE